MTDTFDLSIPGKFDGFLSGSQVAQDPTGWSHDPATQADADLFYACYRAGITIRTGTGYRLQMHGLTAGAVAIVGNQARYCVDANLNGDPDHAELAAARKVAALAADILDPLPDWIFESFWGWSHREASDA